MKHASIVMPALVPQGGQLSRSGAHRGRASPRPTGHPDDCCRISGVPDCDGVTLALPYLAGGEGARATIPLPLDTAEQEGLHRSAGIRREAIESLNLK